MRLAELVDLAGKSGAPDCYEVYLKGGVPLIVLVADIISKGLDFFRKINDKITVKKIYPIDNDLFIELTGVKVVCKDENYDVIYECLDAEK